MMPGPRVQIVAEAAQGFEGRPVQALLLVRAAAAAGADYIKFQLVYADELAVPGYQYFDLFRALEMPDQAWRDVAAESQRLNIKLAFDVYGPRSLALAMSLDASALKLHSTDFFNVALVDAVIATGRDVWFSIGGIEFEEVREFLSIHPVKHADQLTLLYGFQAEPTATGDNHLRRLVTLRQTFPTVGLGFMDHAEATSDEAGWLGLVALPFGARVIEKHLTIGRALGLEDAVSALDAADFARYVVRLRAAEQALGDAAMAQTDVERRYRRRALKAVLAARAIPAGTCLEAADLQLNRAALPQDATPIHRMDQAIGAVTGRALVAGEPIQQRDLA